MNRHRIFRTSAVLLCPLLAIAAGLWAPTAAAQQTPQARARSADVLQAPGASSNRGAPVLSIRRLMPLPVILAQLQAVGPYDEMDYIGVERFDATRGLYALRFLEGRRLVVVVVDAFTGRVVQRIR